MAIPNRQRGQSLFLCENETISRYAVRAALHPVVSGPGSPSLPPFTRGNWVCGTQGGGTVLGPQSTVSHDRISRVKTKSLWNQHPLTQESTHFLCPLTPLSPWPHTVPPWQRRQRPGAGRALPALCSLQWGPHEGWALWSQNRTLCTTFNSWPFRLLEQVV